jgi:hypothetical protein
MSLFLQTLLMWAWHHQETLDPGKQNARFFFLFFFFFFFFSIQTKLILDYNYTSSNNKCTSIFRVINFGQEQTQMVTSTSTIYKAVIII